MDAPESRDQSQESASTEVAPSIPAHKNHCFVVMPFGSGRTEQNWYRGWYEMVIEQAVSSCGYEPILAATEEQPGAINDEIRAHLVFDPMVVVDLGGMEREETPNPNVMYELGIRHAFGLPLVILAWEGQRLPFDVSNQRAIMTDRGMLDIEPTRRKLVNFIRSAADGRFYNPMEAVGREAAIDATSLVLGEESLLGALANEVRELRGTMTSRFGAAAGPRVRKITVKRLLGSLKKELWPIAEDMGFEATTWSKFLRMAVPPEVRREMNNWMLGDWQEYLIEHADDHLPAAKPAKPADNFEDFLETVAELVPAQPWPTGTHKTVAEHLSVPPGQVTRAIKELIRRGRFKHQIDGQIVDDDAISYEASTPSKSEPAEE